MRGIEDGSYSDGKMHELDRIENDEIINIS